MRYVAFLASAVVVSFVLSLTGAANAVTIGLSPASQTVSAGDTVQVDLTVSGLGAVARPSLGAWQIQLSFDTAILAPTGVMFGDGLHLGSLNPVNGFGGSGPLVMFEASLDSEVDLVLLQPSSFTLATVTFDAIGVGSTPLSIAIDGLLDETGSLFDADVETASILVQAPNVIPTPGGMVLLASSLVLFVVRGGRRRRTA